MTNLAIGRLKIITNQNKHKIMGVYKTIEVISSSNDSWEDAARNAVKEAGKSVKNITSVWIKDHTSHRD